MKNKITLPGDKSINTVDCLGMFNPADEFCFRYCSIKLRCVIEQNQINRMESIDDYIYANGSYKIPF
jgi:hypothetical protein